MSCAVFNVSVCFLWMSSPVFGYVSCQKCSYINYIIAKNETA